ncbi:hypothetical protein HDK64DRAFT_331226 [Phyllosticta capitalensis]
MRMGRYLGHERCHAIWLLRDSLPPPATTTTTTDAVAAVSRTVGFGQSWRRDDAMRCDATRGDRTRCDAVVDWDTVLSMPCVPALLRCAALLPGQPAVKHQQHLAGSQSLGQVSALHTQCTPHMEALKKRMMACDKSEQAQAFVLVFAGLLHCACWLRLGWALTLTELWLTGANQQELP